MSDENDQKQGLREAHPPAEKFGAGDQVAQPDPDRVAKIGPAAAIAEAGVGDLARQLADGAEVDAEQQSLMLDEMDEQLALFAGPVKHVAEQIEIARNGRGRPKGSQNKASRQFAETLQRMGYRHPGLNLAALANADPVELAKELSVNENKDGILWRVGCTPADAMAMILKANAELLPYFESKAPTQINVDKQVMGVMIVGEMKEERPADGAIMDLTRVDKPE